MERPEQYIFLPTSLIAATTAAVAAFSVGSTKSSKTKTSPLDLLPVEVWIENSPTIFDPIKQKSAKTAAESSQIAKNDPRLAAAEKAKGTFYKDRPITKINCVTHPDLRLRKNISSKNLFAEAGSFPMNLPAGSLPHLSVEDFKLFDARSFHKQTGKLSSRKRQVLFFRQANGRISQGETDRPAAEIDIGHPTRAAVIVRKPVDQFCYPLPDPSIA